jgi:hypothetical protein
VRIRRIRVQGQEIIRGREAAQVDGPG